MKKVSYFAYSFTSLLVVFSCKTTPQEKDFLNSNVVHGMNDQIITGKFVAKNNLNITHQISITKDRGRDFNVNFSSYDTNNHIYYSIDSKGNYNGYVLVVPFTYNKKTEDLYLNFNGEKLKINYENEANVNIYDLGKKGNNLPKVFTHLVISSKKEVANSELDFIKDLENKYPEDVQLFDNVVLKNRLKILLKNQYDSFIKNFKEQTPITLIAPGVYKTSGCNNRQCTDIQEVIELDVLHNKINVKIFNKKSKKEYQEP